MGASYLFAILITITAAWVSGCSAGEVEVGASCGDAICDASESCTSCPEDCGACESYCGDATCDDGVEDCETCVADCGVCGSSCGDALCDGAIESCESCAADCGDCPAVCGDSICSAAVEDCNNCAADCGLCGSACGDGTCDSVLEDCESCAQDCGSCDPFCGDATCQAALEACDSCEKDCGPCQTVPPPSPNALAIVSWNVFFGNSRANFVDALNAFQADGIDIVGFNELSSHDKPAALKEKTGCTTCFYDAWIPGNPGEGGNVSIIWKKSRFNVVLDNDGKPKRYKHKVHGAEPVEDGAGGTTTTPKYITYVHLRDKQTNRTFWMMNAHALPSVEGKCGHPANKPKRLALYKKMMDAYKTLITGKTDPIFITGDYNVNYRCDRDVRHYRFPWQSFNSLNPKLKSNWEWHEKAGKSLPAVGTHKPHLGGRRLIDYVFARSSPAVSYKSSLIWENRRFGSDHAPTQATYSLSPK
jgi:exonuclease III